MQEELKKTAEAMLDEPIKVTINTAATTRKQKLFKRIGLFKERREYFLRPLTIGSFIRISKLVLPVDLGIIKDKKSILDIGYYAYKEHGSILVKIAAIALTNTKEEPTEEFEKLIEHNVSASELLIIYAAVIRMMDVNSFISSIISIRGVNLLEMNPKTQGSSIASGEQSEE